MDPIESIAHLLRLGARVEIFAQDVAATEVDGQPLEGGWMVDASAKLPDGRVWGSADLITTSLLKASANPLDQASSSLSLVLMKLARDISEAKR